MRLTLTLTLAVTLTLTKDLVQPPPADGPRAEVAAEALVGGGDAQVEHVHVVEQADALLAHLLRVSVRGLGLGLGIGLGVRGLGIGLGVRGQG